MSASSAEPSPRAAPRPRSWDRGRVPLALGAILLLAGALRFTGLDVGLRHELLYDEQLFVENVRAMLRAGDLDHRFYEYPGLFFYLLAPAVALAGDHDRAAYAAARGVVAAFGVASVALVFVLGRRLRAPGAGLAAALLLAISPLEVWTAHAVRPDVVLEAFVLVALLAFDAVGRSRRRDAAAGAALGAAVAVKFTGALLVPAYLLARWSRPGPRLAGTLLAGATSLAVWAAATPYAVLKPEAFGGGMSDQWGYFYRPRAFATRAADSAWYYAGALENGIGWVGLALAVVGVAAARRDWRRWIAPVSYAVVLFVVLCTAGARFERLVLSGVGVLAVLAGLGFEALGRWPRLRWPVLAAACLPLATSAADVLSLARPSSRDRAVDWLEAHAHPGARVLTAVTSLGIDHASFERVESTGDPAADRLLARSVDLVFWGEPAPAEVVSGLVRVAAFVAERPHLEPTFTLFRVPEGERPRYRPIELTPAMLAASSNVGQLAHVLDGRLDTGWHTDPGPRGEWLSVELPEAVSLGRIELRLGDRPARHGKRLAVSVSVDGRAWRPVPAVQARPQPHVQVRRPGEVSQVLLLPRVRARHLRIEHQGHVEGRRWGLAELEVAAFEGVGP